MEVVLDGENSNDVDVGVGRYDDSGAPHGSRYFRCHSRGDGIRRSRNYFFVIAAAASLLLSSLSQASSVPA